MKKFFKIILIIIVVLIAAAGIAWFGFLKPKPLSISPEDRSLINLMPLPSELTLNKGQFEIDSKMGFTFIKVKTPRLDRAIARFYSKISLKTGILFKDSDTKKLILDCSNKGGQYPSVNDDESYRLSVSNKNITISANSETGILYGLESLFQLSKEQKGKWIVPTLKLIDKPRYPWRGIMIDVCRHWIPKEVIMRNLDAMATVKMNVLHLHLTDNQGFRIESKVFPKLHEMGSAGNYFTQSDIKEIIDYAADLGIRIVPEFDLPGHATSWLVGYPELASKPGFYKLDTTFRLADPVLDPTKEKVYKFLDQFIGEMATLFPDKNMHIGGDEVKPKQWNASVEIQQFMKDNKFKDNHELQAYFNIRLQRILKKHGKKMNGWDEILNPNLPKDGIVVQSWRNQKSLWEAARNGYKAILSSGYYLDHKQTAGFHYNIDPLVIKGAVTIDIDSTNWKSWNCKILVKGMDVELKANLYLFGENENLRGYIDMNENSSSFTNATLINNNLKFKHEGPFGEINYELTIKNDSITGEAKMPIFTLEIKGKRIGGSDMIKGAALPNFSKIEPLTEKMKSNILGGEACMWSEMIDKNTIESRIWPRTAAIAEKLWSPQELTSDIDDMYRRLMVVDNELDKLGLKHHLNSKKLIQGMVDKKYVNSLYTLVSVLQEDKLFNRMQIYKPELYTSTPLNRIVDAAQPESYIAYLFGKDVNLWIKTRDKAAQSRIIRSLKIWSNNYDELALAFKTTEHIQEVEQHSKNLSNLSKLALAKIENMRSINKSEIDSLLKEGVKAYGGTTLAVFESIKKLLVMNEKKTKK